MDNLNLSAKQINNTNEHFSTDVVEVSRQSFQQFQLTGSPNIYTANRVSTYNDEVLHLRTPDDTRDSWNLYDITRVTTKTQVRESDPAQILSGGAMRVFADAVLNDKSRIIAGGALSANIGTLNNTTVDGDRTIDDQGVEGKTSLVGGVIASSDDAVRNGKNSFASTGVVTQRDIVNIAAHSAQSVSVSAGTGGSAGASAGIGRDSGSQTTITRSGIGVSTSEDNTRAIKPIFDAQKVQTEVNVQTQITQAFSRKAPKAVASTADSQITKLKEQAKNETDPEKRVQLEAEQEYWKVGGRYRVVLHTTSAALSGGVAGAAASVSAAPLMDALQANTRQALQEAGLSSDSAKVIAQGISGVAAAGMGAVVGGRKEPERHSPSTQIIGSCTKGNTILPRRMRNSWRAKSVLPSRKRKDELLRKCSVTRISRRQTPQAGSTTTKCAALLVART